MKRVTIEDFLSGFNLDAEQVRELRAEIDALPGPNFSPADEIEVPVEISGEMVVFTLRPLTDEFSNKIATAGATVALNREIERKDAQVKTETLVTPSGVVKVPGRLSAPQRAALERLWRERYRGRVAGDPISPPWNRFERWGFAALLVLAAVFVFALIAAEIR